MRHALWLVLLVGCAHAPTSSTTTLSTDDPEVTRLLGQLKDARGLAPTQPIQVKRLSPAEYHQALQQHLDLASHDAELKKEQQVWIAFGFAQPSVDAKGVYQKTADEQFAAYYDKKTKTLILPLDGGKSVANLAPDFLLTHELEHALQDQHFGIDAMLAHAHTRDEQLAVNSMIEGDAMLAAFEVLAQQNHQPLSEALAREIKVLNALPTADLLKLSGHSDALLADPTIVRDDLIFPYLGGLEFLARLELTGGNALIDQVFAHLPQTTRQIADPKAYLRGLHPLPLVAPAPPAGMEIVDQGSLGALGVRAWFEQHRVLSALQANGWRGDAYTVSRAPNGSLLLLWTLALSNPQSATLLVQNLKKLGAGWGSAEATGTHLPPGLVVVQDQALVGVLAGSEDATLAATLLAPLPAAIADSPPLEIRTLAPLPRLAEDHDSGTVTNGVFASEPLGLTLPIPAGFVTAKTPATAANGPFKLELLIRSQEPGSSGVFSFLPTSYADTLSVLVTQLSPALLQSAHLDMVALPPEAIDLGWAQGTVLRYQKEGSPRSARLVLAPLCEGHMTLMFFTISGTEAVVPALTQWPKDVVPTSTGSVCAAIPSSK